MAVKSRTTVGQYTSSQHLHSRECSPEAKWGATVTVPDIYGLNCTMFHREVFVARPNKYLFELWNIGESKFPSMHGAPRRFLVRGIWYLLLPAMTVD